MTPTISNAGLEWDVIARVLGAMLLLVLSYFSARVLAQSNKNGEALAALTAELAVRVQQGAQDHLEFVRRAEMEATVEALRIVIESLREAVHELRQELAVERRARDAR